jgi:hypothetical protein
MTDRVQDLRLVGFGGRAFLGLILVAAVLAMCAGCAPTTTEASAGQKGNDPMVYTDRETGCDYLTTQDRVILTPRIAADGKTHMGCKGDAR